MAEPDTRMRDLRAPLKKLADGQLAQAERTDLTTMHFSEPVGRLRVLRRLGEGFAQEREDELPPNVVNGVRQMFGELATTVDEMIAFNLEDPNAGNVRQDLIRRVQNHYDQMIGNYRVHLRSASNTAAAVERVEQAEERASQLLAQLDTTTASADSLVKRVETLAAEMAAGNLSSYYDTQADNHRRASQRFLRFAGWGGLGVALLAVILFVTIEDRPTSEWTAYVRDLGVRVFVLGVGLYALGFFIKSYRANQHLMVVNEHKANALKTFRLFQESVTEDGPTRDLVTAELVKAVFAADATGFLDNAPDRTVVDGQTGLLAMLAQQARQ